MRRALMTALVVGMAAWATPLTGQAPAAMSVVLFDLGNTLVKRVPDGARATVWIDSTQVALAQLASSGVRLGILSNTGNFSWTEVREQILPEDFDPTLFEEDLIIVSSAVGAQKPDPKIFAYAIERAGVMPGQILFVTESVDHVIAAQASGLRALWVTEGLLPQLIGELIDRNLVGSD